MTGYRPAPKVVPPNLYGRRDRDLTIRFYDKFIGGYVGWSMLIHRRAVKSRVDDNTTTMVILEKRVEAQDENVISLILAAPDDRELLPWHPGAHLDLRLPSGRQRLYSLCGDPADRRRYRFAVRRIPDGNGGSIEIHDELQVGSEIKVRGPHNGFGFVAPGYGSPAKHLHFVAGGIGITPILPMARLAQRLQLDWTMTYTGRSRDSLPFLDEVAEFGDRVTIRTDDEHGLPDPKELLNDVRPNTAIYTCGPVPMIGGMLDVLRNNPEVEFHYERFSAPPVVDGTAFEVELARTGETLEVPADRTVLEVVRQKRPNIAYSCQQGFCRTCIVRVLKGTVDHRDTALIDEDRDRGDMLVCVSRAAGDRLVLDL
ncbi:PDR/VanB family oxidoreductase [Antrihabitans sp. NCIMB 15449]|uniref:PDR/VanB family oxidoreductase n=1 Tax=Antrihabitans spumae TaxID=3373370 RepID=A0ABW7JR57_9NOCA